MSSFGGSGSGGSGGSGFSDGNRKTRRSRDAGGAGGGGGGSVVAAGNYRPPPRDASPPSSSPTSLSGFDLYTLQGDARAAHERLVASKKDDRDDSSFVRRYNQWILSALVEGPGEDFVAEMARKEDEMRKKSQQEDSSSSSSSHGISPRKRRRNELIVAFNRALTTFAGGLDAGGAAAAAADLCATHLRELMTDGKGATALPDEYAGVATRMAFLWLECHLAHSAGPVSSGGASLTPDLTPEKVVHWLDSAFDSDRDPQLKFLLNLYRSRVDLAALDGAGKHDDAKIRSARKELKQAMDVFQHRLRPALGADGTSGSVVSSANSEENTYASSSAAAAASTAYDGNASNVLQPAAGSVVLQRHNQSALSLKANSEQLKGNTKKSLILCGEAQAALTSPTSAGGSAGTSSNYEVLHENNLAIIYETIGKKHLAMHALAKALRAADSSNPQRPAPAFFPDGTARPDPTLTVLHNAAMCALRARNYASAYQCLSACLAASDVYRGRPRCWLRLAEACVGIFAADDHRHRGQRQGRRQPFSPILVGGEPRGILVDNSLFDDHPRLASEELAPLASPEDLEQVKRNPLVRARDCLARVIQSQDDAGSDVLASARLTLSYIHLAFQEYGSALDMAKLVLDSPEPADGDDDVTRRCHRRRIATARMYAAEGSCALGASMDAMKFLVGDGQDDAFDRLASDLGGVTIETAASNGKGKRRLARAQTAVRSSASAVTADLGNLTAAKQLAMSAQAMEDAYESNRERSLSRRALAYALLKSGNHGAALSLLRSLT